MKLKQIILITGCLFVILNLSFAQNQFPNKDGEWFIREYDPEGISYFYKTPDYVEKDTLINKQVYSILTSSFFNYRCAIRNDYPKYYYIDLNHPENGENILYDFSLEIGDTIQLIHIMHDAYIDTLIWSVNNIYPDYYSGKNLIELFSQNANYFLGELYWIDGIGSRQGPMYLLNPPVGFESEYNLYCYREKGIPMYGNCSLTAVPEIENNKLHCFFSEKEKLLTVKSPFEKYDLTIFDTKGNIINEQLNICDNEIDLSYLNKGIYICKLCAKGKTISQKIRIN